MSYRFVLVLSALYQRGGIQRFNRMLCLALDRLAPELDLSITAFSLLDSDEDYRRQGTPFSHIEFVSAGGKLGLTTSTLRLCIRQRPDLMLIGLLGMSPLGLICAPFLRRGYGFVAHGYECWDGPPSPPPPPSHRLAARRARFAFAVSKHTRDALIRSTGMRPDSVSLLPNTLDPHFETMPAESSIEGDGVPPEFLVVARLWAEDKMKGIDHTLRAFAGLLRTRTSARLRIVGDGSDLPRLEALTRELGLGENVIFEQNLSDDDLADRYRRSSAFVLPSGQEGFGIVFLEAMQFGKPCIGGRAGGTPDVIIDGETGFLVPYGDESALREAMVRLLDDADLRETMGRAGHARLVEHFTFPTYQERLGAELRRLLHDD